MNSLKCISKLAETPKKRSKDNSVANNQPSPKKQRRKASTSSKENPRQYLINQGRSEPTDEKQKAIYVKNKRKKNSEEVESFSPKEMRNHCLYENNKRCEKVKEVVTEETSYDSNASTSTMNSLKFISNLAKIPENKKRKRLDQTSYPKNLPMPTKVIGL